MSTINTAHTKRPFKLIEIVLNKFRNEAVPHHQDMFLKHKGNILKLRSINDLEQLDREVRDKKRVVRQLKELMYELDTLRTQVEDFDLDNFDGKTVQLRKIILELISGYAGIEMQTTKIIEEYKIDKHNDTEQIRLQLQLQDDIESLKLQEKENQLRVVEALNNDIKDVHNIFVDLNQMVSTQREHVDIIELNCEIADNHIKGGLFHLMKASKLKKASYPIAGAFIGTIIGGPIGSVAGLKIGGLAAIGCGLAGYISGKFFKGVGNVEVLETEVELEKSNNINKIDNKGLPDSAVNDKKDI